MQNDSFKNREKARDAAWRMFATTGDPSYYDLYVSLKGDDEF